MKKLVLLIALALPILGFSQANIAAARAMGVGATVTVKGVVTNGSELGVIRYIQDASAGIAAYSSTMSGVKRGDSVTVTGVLKDYNNLLEIDPVNSFTVHASNTPLPTPVLITPSQLSEPYEAELVRINNCTFNNAGATFASNSSYNFTSGGQTGVVYIRSGHPLIGKIIPTSPVHLIGICSQFSYSNPSAGYQLLLRDSLDIISTTTISITSPITQSAITQTGFTLTWQTNITGTPKVLYGRTTNFELGYMPGTSSGTTHTVVLTGLQPADIIYVKAITIAGNDTAKSAMKVFATRSNSSGQITVYFNKPVDNTVAAFGTNAINIGDLVDDTLVQYINRATETIDMAIYNMGNQNIANIGTALNNALGRGVRVRLVYDGSTTMYGLSGLSASIGKIASPTGANAGIMHNKFVVFDANSTNAEKAIVWTGSCNMTYENINQDANNIIIFHDQSMAKAYTLEFEEMFGSTGAQPSASQAKFGAQKADNTPHLFNLNGKRVEVYFSPSDNTNDQILNAINSADFDMHIGTMLITRSDLAYAIQNADQRGVNCFVLVNSRGECGTVVPPILQAALGNHFVTDSVEPYILHNKYMVVDQGDWNSNPLVLTGSHNWSNAANNTNDENTVIVYDPYIANMYYQAFVKRFYQNTGIYISLPETGKPDFVVSVFPNPVLTWLNLNIVSPADIKNAVLTVFDLSGRRMMIKNLNLTKGHNDCRLDVSNLNSGCYIMEFSGGKTRIVNRIVIE